MHNLITDASHYTHVRQGLLDHTCEWHLVDICDPDTKVMHGKCPYAVLEDMQPCAMTMEMFDKYSVLGADLDARKNR